VTTFKCEVDQTKLRSVQGVMKTEGLFWEKCCKLDALANRNPTDPVYTLKDYDHNGYPSMYIIYMDSATEYEAALRLLGSWRHWKKLCKSLFFKTLVDEWREERQLREEALAKTALLESIVEGNVSAAKTILDEKKKRVAGRPTTEVVKGEIVRAAEEQNNLTNLIERMSNV
jgi:hypothetical protein